MKAAGSRSRSRPRRSSPSTLGAEGFAPHRTEVQSAAARERSNVVITLGRGSSLAGRAVDESGTPIAGATASLEVSPGNGRSSSGSNEQPKTATATDDGRFAFSHLPPEFYELTVAAPGHSANRRPGIAVERRRGRSRRRRARRGGDALWTRGRRRRKPDRRRGRHRVRRQAGRCAFTPHLDDALSPPGARREGGHTDRRRGSIHADRPVGRPSDRHLRRRSGLRAGQCGAGRSPDRGRSRIRLRRAGSVAGRVVDREGEPVAATLSFDRGTRIRGVTSSGERSNVLGATDIEGRFASRIWRRVTGSSRYARQRTNRTREPSPSPPARPPRSRM